MSAIEEQELTTSAALTKNSADIVHVRSMATFLLSVFGLPGNALVIAVYARQTKTSTRAYMFALAVADLAVCLSAIVLTRVALNHLELQVVVWVGHSTVTFSALLLAFVSVERLLAVRRPHSFSLSVERARRALAGIMVAAFACSTVLAVARVFDYKLLFRLVSATVTLANVAIMIICYTLMGMTLLQKAKRVNILTHSQYPTPGPSTVSRGTSAVANCNISTDRVESTQKSTIALRVNKPTANHTTCYKDLWLLFTITFVFLACWMPVWLSYAGLSINPDLQRVYIVNSIVNPFIYSVVSVMFRNDLRLFYNKTRRILIGIGDC